jgi:hypothetical protein
MLPLSRVLAHSTCPTIKGRASSVHRLTRHHHRRAQDVWSRDFIGEGGFREPAAGRDRTDAKARTKPAQQAAFGTRSHVSCAERMPAHRKCWTCRAGMCGVVCGVLRVTRKRFSRLPHAYHNGATPRISSVAICILGRGCAERIANHYPGCLVRRSDHGASKGAVNGLGPVGRLSVTIPSN